jgi:hypothetical protein
MNKTNYHTQKSVSSISARRASDNEIAVATSSKSKKSEKKLTDSFVSKSGIRYF